MHTEEEARKKWCPFVRLAAAGGEHPEWHNNRPTWGDVEKAHFDRCIAFECMAWRWRGSRAFRADGTAYRDDEGAPLDAEIARTGYCALARPD